MIRLETEQDPEALRAFAQCARRENELLRRRIATLVDRLAKAEGVEQTELLTQELAELNKALSSPVSPGLTSKSERRPRDQKDDSSAKAQTGHGPTEQPELVVVDEILELDEADQICPECGGHLGPIDDQFEESELIDVVDVEYKIRKIKRQKYRCDNSCCQHIDTALGTDDRLKDGGRYSVDFGVSVVENKYLMHLPLTRQAKQMRLAGLDVTSQTLWDQLWEIACLLEPSWQHLHLVQLAESVVGADESRWRLLGKNKLAKPQIIGLTSCMGVWYGFEMDKTAETVDKILKDFSGWLVVDGLSIYPAVHQIRHDGWVNGTREAPPFQIANCWVHARRYFIKAEPDFIEAGDMLELIAKLYRVVEAARAEDIDEDTRKEWIEALLKGMKDWMLEARPPPDSSIERAIAYMQNHWAGLTRFVENPEVWLDNNATERALRAPILGRKNHYGSRSKRGMKAAAILYSLIETCQVLGVNPREYLRQAVRSLKARRGEVYLPHQMLPADDPRRLD